MNVFKKAEVVLEQIESGKNYSIEFFNENRKLLSLWCFEPFGNPSYKDVVEEVAKRTSRIISAEILCEISSQDE